MSIRCRVGLHKWCEKGWARHRNGAGRHWWRSCDLCGEINKGWTRGA